MPPSLPVNWLPHVEQASGPRLAEGTAEEDGSGESGQLGSSGVLVNTLFQGHCQTPILTSPSLDKGQLVVREPMLGRPVVLEPLMRESSPCAGSTPQPTGEGRVFLPSEPSTHRVQDGPPGPT